MNSIIVLIFSTMNYILFNIYNKLLYYLILQIFSTYYTVNLTTHQYSVLMNNY